MNNTTELCIRCYTTLWNINVSNNNDNNDKLQGSVATYSRCGRVVNNQIKKGLLLSLSENIFKIGEYLAKLKARTWLSGAVSPSFSSVLVKRTSALQALGSLVLVTVSKQLSNKCIAVCKVATPLRELTCHMGSHSVTPATRQRWHSRPYPSRSWYSIKRPRRDARLS